MQKHSTAYRRLTIRGKNGVLYPYLVQYSPGRHARTEERVLSLFRMLNVLLEKRKESRRRHLFFFVPRVVPLTIHVRLVEDDVSCISLEDIFADHCAKVNIPLDSPIMQCYDSRQRTIMVRV